MGLFFSLFSSVEKENTFTSDIGWDNCPTEILIMIFRYLDFSDLLFCELINSKWREVANFVYKEKNPVELNKHDREIWDMHFKDSKPVNLRDLYIDCQNENRQPSVNVITQTDRKCIKKIRIYRNRIILVSDSSVKIFDARNGKLSTGCGMSCHDFHETDYMYVVLKKVNTMKTLTLYKKHPANTGYLEHLLCVPFKGEVVEIKYIHSYHVDDENCYLVDKLNCVKSYYRPCVGRMLGRYYGPNNSIQSIHVHQRRVYLATTWGEVYVVEDTRVIRRMAETEISTCTIMKERKLSRNYMKEEFKNDMSLSIIVHETTCPQDNIVTYFFVNVFSYLDQSYYRFEKNMVNFVFKCDKSELTFGTRYGSLVILGFKNGTVEIIPLGNCLRSFEPHHDRYAPIQRKPIIEFNINNLGYKEIPDPSIIGVNLLVNEKNITYL